jgi:hypothetical protein
MFQTEERKARMFEMGLKPQIRRYLVSQNHSSLREVADAALKQESEYLDTLKGKEVVAKAVDKGKGKRPIAAIQQQGGAQAPGPDRQKNPLGCHKCGRLGHFARECRSGGPQGGRGQGYGQQSRGQQGQYQQGQGHG